MPSPPHPFDADQDVRDAPRASGPRRRASDEAHNHVSDLERELLLLLGRGHTAKSIAALKNLSEHAVNERFRFARRKTGIGSSRGIARLLVAQEIRDDFIGLAEPAGPAARLLPSDAHRPSAPPQRWRILMAAAVLLATALLAQQTSVLSTPPSRSPVTVSGSGAAASRPTADAASLHAQVLADLADPAWSPMAEAELTRLYTGIPTAATWTESLSVTCSASLCEVLAVGNATPSTDEINAFIRSVSVPGLRQAEDVMRMKLQLQHLTSTPVGRLVMAAYWRRQE